MVLSSLHYHTFGPPSNGAVDIDMTMSSRTARLGLLILACALGASALPTRNGPSVFASDAAESVQKRAIIKGDEYVPLGHTKIPLSPLLLIFGGLGAAAIGMVIAMIRILVPSCMSRSSRIVLEERERARQDLRVRGAVSPRSSPVGSPSGAGTPIEAHTRRFPPNKPPRRVGRNSRGSMTPVDSVSGKRPSHGYRGTSFSLKDTHKHPHSSYRSSLSGFQVPLLNSNDSSSGSSTAHTPLGSTMSERSKYPLAIAEPLGASNKRLSFARGHLNRTSSIGKGADLQRTRSGKHNAEISLHPQSVDPAYGQKWGRRESYKHPLQAEPSRRESTLSMYASSSSAEHSYQESTSTNSRFGSYTNMAGTPLQHLSTPSFTGTPHVNQPWASPPTGSRSSSPISPDLSRLSVAHNAVGNSRNSSVSGLLDSDGSDHGAVPEILVMVPSRKTSVRR